MTPSHSRRRLLPAWPPRSRGCLTNLGAREAGPARRDAGQRDLQRPNSASAARSGGKGGAPAARPAPPQPYRPDRGRTAPAGQAGWRSGCWKRPDFENPLALRIPLLAKLHNPAMRARPVHLVIRRKFATGGGSFQRPNGVKNTTPIRPAQPNPTHHPRSPLGAQRPTGIYRPT